MGSGAGGGRGGRAGSLAAGAEGASKLTSQLVERIAGLDAAGATLSEIAAATGVSTFSVRNALGRVASGGQSIRTPLTTRASLAHWTGEAGDEVAARDMFAVLLAVRERLSGSEHPDTLDARHMLARWTGEAGAPSTARDMFAVLLPVREQVSGPDHSHTEVFSATSREPLVLE